MHLDFSEQQQHLIERLRELAQNSFAPRAPLYDQQASFPTEDFEDLHREGYLGAAIPSGYGGMGLSPHSGDVFTLWMLTKEIAKADLSLARCWEGHNNSMVLLQHLAQPSQQKRWFEGVMQRGEKWAAWSGEPQTRTPGQKTKIGTEVSLVEGGYVVDGSKVFATSATAAEWAILLVSTEGAGGARHATGSLDSQLLLACDLSDPSVETDDSWWDPIGMRGTVSHRVQFNKTFIPAENAIGKPGQYLREAWQTRFTPQYAASFLGAAEMAYEYALKTLQAKKQGDDPYVQHHLAHMAMNVETGHLWLRHVAHLWETDHHEEAKLAGNRARYLIEHLAEETLRHCIRACGARCLNRPSPLERVYRDLSFYVRHDSDDQVLAMIGKSLMHEDYDVSFFTQKPAP